MPPIRSKTRVYSDKSIPVHGGDRWRIHRVTTHPLNDVRNNIHPGAAYQLTLRTPMADPDANVRIAEQKQNRGRAEIELHLLCESGFRLASGTSHAADPRDVSTLGELMPPRRSRTARKRLASSNAQKKRAVTALHAWMTTRPTCVPWKRI